MWWYILLFGLLAVLLVVVGTMRIIQRRRGGLGHERVYPSAPEHPATQRHAAPPTEARASGGAFRGDGLGPTLKGLFHAGTSETTWRALEDILLKADVGPTAASDMVERCATNGLRLRSRSSWRVS